MNIENERMMNMLMDLNDKYLSGDTKSKVRAAVKEYGDEPEIVKMILHKLNECSLSIDDSDKKTIKEIALYYL